MHDLVAVIDIMLPDGSGLELVEWLRAEGMTQPVLSHSALRWLQRTLRPRQSSSGSVLGPC